MGDEHFGHAVEFIETADRQILDEACAVDAAEELVAFVVALKGGPAIFHTTQPENLRTFDDHAVGPDLDRAIDLDRLRYDEPVDDADGEQAGEIDPHVVNRRMMKQKPAFAAKRRCPCEQTPECVPQAEIKILVDEEDTAFGRQKTAVIDMGVRLESVPG